MPVSKKRRRQEISEIYRYATYLIQNIIVYTLKLVNNWISKAKEKIKIIKNDKYKYTTKLTKLQIKGIDDIIKSSDVVHSDEDSTTYRLRSIS